MRNYLIYGAIALVVVIAIISVGMKKSSDVALDTNVEQEATTTNTVASKPSTTKVTTTPAPKVDVFTSIFPQKGNYRCVYEEVTPSTRSTNVLYFSDGRMRGEFRTLGGSSNIMFYDGRYMYTWIEGQSVGKVTEPKSISDFPAIIPKDINVGVVLGSGLNNASWQCNQWAKDATLLTKPTYVKFY